MIWHYAVWKAGHPTLWPACMSVGEFIHKGLPITQHRFTINRGHVDCIDCLRMMGLKSGRKAICQHGNEVPEKGMTKCKCMLIDGIVHPCYGCPHTCGQCI